MFQNYWDGGEEGEEASLFDGGEFDETTKASDIQWGFPWTSDVQFVSDAVDQLGFEVSEDWKATFAEYDEQDYDDRDPDALSSDLMPGDGYFAILSEPFQDAVEFVLVLIRTS